MKTAYKVAIICSILLLPTLFFPISCDISIYAMGGETIAKGGKLYVDFLDLKPPAIFVLYAVLSKTIGISTFALRSFDFIVQLVTCILIFRIFDKRIFNPISGAWASAIYALLYLTSGYTITMEPESLIGISMCGIFLLMTGKNYKIIRYILIGAISAFLFSIKFTFGIIGGTAVLWELFSRRESLTHSIINVLFILTGAVPGLVLGFFPLADAAVRSEFPLVMKYLGAYSTFQPINGSWVKDSLKNLGSYFGDNISIFISLAAAIGAASLLIYPGSEVGHERKYKFFFFLMGLGLFVTVAIERKFAYMHVMRTFAPISIFAGFGAVVISAKFREAFKGAIVTKAVSLSLVGASLLFSPATRALSLIPPSFYYFFNRENYVDFYQRDNNITILRTQLELTQYLNTTVPENSFAMLIATGSNQINYYRRDKVHTKFSQSQFLMGKLKIAKWQNEFSQEIRRASYIVVQGDDAHPAITGIPDGSYDWIRKSEYWGYIEDHFTEIKRIGSFAIFRKK